MVENIRAKILDEEKLKNLRKENKDKKIVFASGCYDILQSGHAVFFNQCKNFGDILVVGVGRDKIIEQLKGIGRPVNPENNRVFLVASIGDVDYAVLNGEELGEGKIDFMNILEALQPDMFVINDDDSGIDFKKSLCKDLSIEPKTVSRVVPEELIPTSTTNIINKINYAFRAPLRIDFAGGWTDVPYIMYGKKGYVSNVAIKPLIEYKNGSFNFSGYPRGSGLSTSTGAKLLELISAKNYNVENKTLPQIGEDLFNLENKELQWFIGRQDQYSIVYGGFHCFEFGDDYGKVVGEEVPRETLEKFRQNLLLIHTSISRNAQTAVEEVYRNHKTPEGVGAIEKLTEYGKSFTDALLAEDFDKCAEIIDANWQAQKQLAPSCTTPELDEMYDFALKNGAKGGKLCGAGGGGAFVFYCEDPQSLKVAMKKQFVSCFEIDFDFEYNDIRKLNKI
ncbi:adenylyltransferase/cytidyltransferase family protein [Chondrinema litorale]|uniref:adenylyltransferase/cytidyltransferase family protein n=1 Tax=Chondrinema litorale TaxID=2994555 RepID=UPI0025436C1C|nr:adenylyltransferase/cytidyltransferase family protein [Chondrinema litorale]UZR95110.1 adenylyltransferase/cytidyltransferase family protein [Chondrinema litorale]